MCDPQNSTDKLLICLCANKAKKKSLNFSRPKSSSSFYSSLFSQHVQYTVKYLNMRQVEKKKKFRADWFGKDAWNKAEGNVLINITHLQMVFVCSEFLRIIFIRRYFLFSFGIYVYNFFCVVCIFGAHDQGHVYKYHKHKHFFFFRGIKDD